MKKITQSKTLSEQAYSIIKESITNGDLKDNEPLPEERLAKQLGISRTPLRDALNRLHAEGLIVQQKGAPAVVASFTKEKSLEYMELRLLLEVYNIEKIIHQLDDNAIQALEENLDKQRAAIERGDYLNFLEQDRQFHILLANMNANVELQHIIHKVNTGVSRAFIILSNTISQSADGAFQEHQELLQALKQRDIDKAKKKMNIHLNHVKKRFLQYGTA